MYMHTSIDYGSDHSSSLMEFRQLFFFCTSKHVDEWLVYWKRRRLRWWKEVRKMTERCLEIKDVQFSRSPEKFILDEGRERNAIKVVLYSVILYMYYIYHVYSMLYYTYMYISCI